MTNSAVPTSASLPWQAYRPLRSFAGFLRARSAVIPALLVSVLLLAGEATAAVRNWTGTAGDNLWNNLGNWDTAVPVNGDALLFSAAAGLANTNNLVGLSINHLGFSAGGYSLAGNALTINNGLFDGAGSNTNRINLTLGASQSFTSSAGGLVLVGNVTNGPFNLTLQADADLTVSGIIGNGPGAVIKQGVSILTLSGANTFQGGLTINEGQVNIGNANGIPNGAGVGNLTVAATGIADIADGNRTINGLNGAGVVQNTGAGTDTLTIGANATNSAGTFTGTIQDGTGFLGLTKVNTNTFTLNGSGNYNGPTTISAGSFVLGAAGIITSSNISVAEGAALDIAASAFTLGSSQQLTAGRSTNGGPADVVGALVNAGTITVRSPGTAGTLKISGGLNLSGGTLEYDLRNNLAVGGGTNDLITIGGQLNLASLTFIKPSFLDGNFAAGAYTLVNGITSVAGSTANLNAVLPRGINKIFTTPAGSLQMSLSGTATPGTLVWTGSTWDVGVSQSWLNAGSPDVFLNFDNVIFDDSGPGSVAVQDSVTPGSITFSNQTTAYIFPGPGAIGGSGSLTKHGGAQLAFDGPASTYTGPTVINGGELFLDWRTQIPVVPLNNLLYGGNVTNSLTLNNAAQLTLQSGGGIAHAQFFSSLTIGSNVNVSFGPARTANDSVAVYYGTVARPRAGGVMYMNMVQRDVGDLTGEWASNPVGPIGGYAVKGAAPATQWAAVTTTAQLTNQYGVHGWINGYVHSASESGANAFLTNSHNVDVTSANAAGTKTAITINSLRFLAANQTITLAGTNVISNGGILAANGAGNATLIGGSLRSGNGADLIIQQHNAGQPLVIQSIIRDNGTATNLTKAGPGLVALSTNNAYTGTTYILEGTVQLGNGGTSGSLSNMTAIVNRGTFAYKRSDNLTHATPLSGTGGFATFGTGIVTLTADATYAGVTTVGAGAKLWIGNSGTTGSISNSPGIIVETGGNVAFNRSDTYTYDGPISGAGSVSKLGGGTVPLNGVLSHTGNTTVSNGTLVVVGAGSLATSPVIRVDGTLDATALGGLSLNNAVNQLLIGNGAVAGPIALNSGTTVAPGASIGRLTANHDFNFNGGTLALEISTATNDILNVLGTATATGGAIQLTVVGGTISNKTYTLITTPNNALAGSINNLALLGLPPTQIGVLSNNAAGVYLIVSASTAATLTWRGDGAANLWDINTSANWISNGLSSIWLNNQFAVMDDTGSNNVPVNLAGSLLPFVLTVNTTNTYTLAGSGKITSAAAVVKSGSGTLAVLTTNDNFGNTTISAGTVRLGDGVNLGTMQSFQIDNGGALVFNEPADYTNSAIISGSGTLTKLDTNALTLTATSSYTNLTTLKGTLQVGSGGLSGSLGGNVHLVADVVDLGGGIFQTNLATLAFNTSTPLNQGAVTGGGNLANYGNGTLMLTASNSYTGDTLFGNGGSGTLVQGVAGAIPGGSGYGNLVGSSGAVHLNLNGFNTLANLLTGTGGFIENGTAANTATLTIGANGASSVVGYNYGGALQDHASGSGVLRLVKVGPGSQSLNGVSSFTGGLRIEGGELALRNSNAGGANANAIELAGGNLRMGGITLNTPGTLTVTSNALIAMEGVLVMNGLLAGPTNITLTISNPAAARLDWGSTMNGSTFAGTIKFTDNSGGNIRNVNQNGWTGSPNITFDLGLGTVFIGPRNRSLIMELGALTGGPSTFLTGGGSGDQVNDPNIYVIGGKHLDTEFQGTIQDNTPGNGGAPRLTKIRKTGTGRLVLSGNTPYTAGTTVSNGVLVITNLAYLRNVTVFTNAYVGAPGFQNPTNFALTLVSPGVLDVTAVTADVTPGTVTLGGTAVEQIIRGDGTLRGSLTTLANSTLTPGFSIGTLTITNALAIGGTTVMEISSPSSSDRLVANSLTSGGALIVTNIGGVLGGGNSFLLLSASIRGGTFASVALPPLSGGLTWSNSLAIDGRLTILGSSVNPTPTNIASSVSGNQLTLTWPADHIGWRLQVQTNLISVGLRSNWVDVAGSTAVNTMSFTINPANGTVFYRMVYP